MRGEVLFKECHRLTHSSFRIHDFCSKPLGFFIYAVGGGEIFPVRPGAGSIMPAGNNAPLKGNLPVVEKQVALSRLSCHAGFERNPLEDVYAVTVVTVRSSLSPGCQQRFGEEPKKNLPPLPPRIFSQARPPPTHTHLPLPSSIMKHSQLILVKFFYPSKFPSLLPLDIFTHTHPAHFTVVD